MHFNQIVDSLIAKVQSETIDEAKFYLIANKIKEDVLCHFPKENVLYRVFEMLSIEPQEIYFPEMYEKLKKQNVDNIKEAIITFLNQTKEEYALILIDKPIAEVLLFEESDALEFKSTLCWDIDENKQNKKKMGEIIIKAISAFSNSNGGVLLIGVRDNKDIYGLENDYSTFKEGKGNKDDFELHLTTLLINNFSSIFAKENIKIEFNNVGAKEICVLRIKKSNEPWTVNIADKSGGIKQKFFVRIKNSSRSIEDLLELAKYIKKRFPTWE